MIASDRVKVTHLIDSLGIGGAQEIVKLIIKKTNQEFHHTVVVLNGTAPHHLPALKVCGADVIFLTQPSRNKTELIFKVPFIMWRFRNILKKLNSSILHLHLEGSMVIGSIASIGIPVKKIIRIYARKAQLPIWVHPVLRLIAPIFDRVICGDGIEHELKYISSEKLLKASIGIDRDIDFKSGTELIRKEFNLQKKGPFLFVVGRLHPDKDPAKSISVFKIVKEKLPGSVLFIIGEGDSNVLKQIYQLSESLKIEDLYVTGYRDDVQSFFGLGGFFLRMSHNEWGNVANALAGHAGLVVIGFDVSQNVHSDRDMIQDNVTGKIIPFGDIDLMANTIIETWKDPRKYELMSKNAVLHYRAQWDIDKNMIDPIASLYRSLA